MACGVDECVFTRFNTRVKVHRSMCSVELAVRRLIELNAIQSQLGKTQEEALTLGQSCIESYSFDYGGNHRGDLVEFERATYQYTSLLHMLGEIVSDISDNLGVQLRENDPVKHSVPRLIGLRHCLHHNGLLGIQVIEAEGLSRPVLGIPVRTVKQRGQWGDGKSTFEQHFHSVSSDFLVVKNIIQESRGEYTSIISELKSNIESNYEQEQLDEVSSGVSLHR